MVSVLGLVMFSGGVVVFCTCGMCWSCTGQDGGASLAAAVSSCSSCLCIGGRGGGLDVMVSSCSGIEVS